MDDLDITSRLRSMEVNISASSAEDSIDLKFMFEWVLSVLSDDPSVGPVLDESFQRSALLHQLPGSLRFRSDAHSPQTIMFRYLVKNKKFYFEVHLHFLFFSVSFTLEFIHWAPIFSPRSVDPLFLPMDDMLVILPFSTLCLTLVLFLR